MAPSRVQLTGLIRIIRLFLKPNAVLGRMDGWIKYCKIVFISLTLLTVLGCSAIEQAIDEIPIRTRQATASPSGDSAVSPTASPNPRQIQMPPRRRISNPRRCLTPPRWAHSRPRQLRMLLYLQCQPTAAPADPSTPDTTVAEATPILVGEPEPEALATIWTRPRTPGSGPLPT